jgi:formylglycine-generating enzyme required for sulfatase activity
LPRLWKSESDSSGDREETGSESARKKPSTEEDKTARKPKSATVESPRPKAKKGSAGETGNQEKKVLVEETPALDTYESRRKARMLMGGLTGFCVLLAGWITWRVFLYNSGDPVPSGVEPPLKLGLPDVRNRDAEARFYLKQAREYAKNGRTKSAIDMLKQVVVDYKGTATAAEAKAALDRPRQNLPLFPEGPVIVAEHQKVETQPALAANTAPDPAKADTPGPDGSIPVQPQPAQPQPPPLPPGPGQAAVITANNATGSASTPQGAEDPGIARAIITPRPITPRTLPPGFKAEPGAELHESGWPMVIVGEREGGSMVLVPGGTFTMGNDGGEPAEAPTHAVRLSTFYIDQYEVTPRQFRLFLDDKRRGQPRTRSLTDEKVRGQSESAPVVWVDYKDAEAFALWAGKRLPTEAQWEMAARSTDGRRFPWGDQPIDRPHPRDFHQVEPVKSFPADVSPYSAFDMAGNAMEWVRDWYDPKYFEKLRDKVVENPTGPATHGLRSIQRVVKGGSKDWTVTSRQGIDADKRLPTLGFRCAMAVEGPEAAAIITPHPVKPDAAQPGANPPPTAPPPGDVPF